VNLMTKLEITPKATPYMILAPARAKVPKSFEKKTVCDGRYEAMLAKMQIMRGRIALAEGAIRQDQLDSENRYWMPRDRDSWHLLRVGNDGSVEGCIRILEHDECPGFHSLRLSNSALARNNHWSSKVKAALESEVEQVGRRGGRVVEPGFWALNESLRGSREGVSIALSVFAWSQLIGDRVAYVTATVRNDSCGMLRRLGGRSLDYNGEQFPRYFDPEYDCEMELLKFDMAGLNPRFEVMLAPLRKMLSCAPIFQADGRRLGFGQIAA
jgi:hypothetical protein